MTTHEYAVYAAIAAIGGLTALALWLGAADGALAAAITALSTLGGAKIAMGLKNGGETGSP